jgi:membrane protein YqaA with SNARE-associated domain
MDSLLEKYLLLFTDSCYTSLIFSFNSEIILWSMLGFNYNQIAVSIVSSLGWYVGHLINYLFGIIFARIHKATSDSETKNRNYAKLQEFYSGRYQLMMLLTAVPFFGSILTTFSGYAKYNLKRFTILTIISRIIYLIYKLAL